MLKAFLLPIAVIGVLASNVAHAQIGRPAEPAVFWSSPNQFAQFQLTRTENARAITKSFQGGNPPYTQEIALDPRLTAIPRLYGSPTRETSHWSFIAVRTGASVRVSIRATAFNRWNIYHPRSGARLSRNGFDIVFKWGFQELGTVSTGGNFVGNANRCGQGVDTMTIPDFSITADLFEKMDNIEIRPKSEAYYACPGYLVPPAFVGRTPTATVKALY